MWRRVMMPRAGATDEQAAFLSRETREKGRKKKRPSSRRELASSASEIRLKKLVF